jgi:hypothetical protein
MSLVIAGVEEAGVWMVSDTAITGGDISLRQRRYLPKVEVSRDKRALIGFAGNDAHNAARLVAVACTKPASHEGLEVLLQGSAHNPSVEFAYATYDNGKPRLLHISGGKSADVLVLHLGNHAAFETFQRIRHGEAMVAPLAFRWFMCGANESAKLRGDGLPTAIKAMIELFAMRAERDVGGWAVPYLLTENGAVFFGYVYSESDPIFDKLVPGSIIPHGTPSLGGVTLSVTELPNEDGMVVYWLQLPGGTVLVRSDDGEYKQYTFRGTPTQFKADVQAAIGQTPELWVEERPPSPVKALRIMRAADGGINAVIADHGGALSVALHNLATRFDFSQEMRLMKPGEQDDPENDDRRRPLFARLSDDKHSVGLEVRDEKQRRVELGAVELDALIRTLGDLRAQMINVVPMELLPGTQMMMIIDPKWRTERSPHPAVKGVLLMLRHIGFGWLSFLLPYHEARSLGRWLNENAAAADQPPTTPDAPPA